MLYIGLHISYYKAVIVVISCIIVDHINMWEQSLLYKGLPPLCL